MSTHFDAAFASMCNAVKCDDHNSPVIDIESSRTPHAPPLNSIHESLLRSNATVDLLLCTA